jgi:zinc protease
MADELSAIVVKEIKTFAEQGPKSEDIEKIRKYMLKEWQNQLESNNNWASWLDQYNYRGVDYVGEYEEAVKSITVADIQALAKKILADGNMCYVVMRPEK